MSAGDVLVGDEFAGHRIEAVLGRGGMGVVYRAVHIELDTVVALKVIAPQLAVDPDFRERFRRERRLAASLRHPNIVATHHAGEENGQLFVTMDYIEGTDLSAMIATGGRLEPSLAARLVAQVAAALDAAHARGLVHRDVKPANVLIETATGGETRAYLTDFGLTRHVDSNTKMTGTGMLVGTIDYIAPEQLEDKGIDARTDVYSLGCVLYHLLTGEVPYPRDHQLAAMHAHLHAPPPALAERASDVPVAFESVIAKALAKNPDDRYQSAGELGRAAVAAADPTTILRPEPPKRPDPAPAPPTPASPPAPPTNPAATAVLPHPARAGISHSAWRRALWLIPAALLLGGVIALSVLSGSGSSPSRPTQTHPVPLVYGSNNLASVAFGDGAVWMTHVWKKGQGPAKLTAFDPGRGHTRRSIKLGQANHSSLVVASGKAWVVNRTSSTLERVNLASGTVEISTPLPGAATGSQQLAVGSRDIWITQASGGAGFLAGVNKLSPSGASVKGNDSFAGLAVSAVGVWAWDQTHGNLRALQTSNHDVGLPHGATAPSLALGAGYVWGLGSGVLTRIDPTTLKTTAFTVPPTPAAGANNLAFGGGSLWALAHSKVYRIDPATGKVTRKVTITQSGTAITFGAGAAWVIGDHGLTKITA